MRRLAVRAAERRPARDRISARLPLDAPGWHAEDDYTAEQLPAVAAAVWNRHAVLTALRARLPIESIGRAHDGFLRLDADIEVLEPAELRERIAATARALACTYADTESGNPSAHGGN
ncbi:WYL domain-containing protein [Streptomyces sp. NPDC002795]|uniref:WYL domain-containing protein n=1 Tax=Streptomyces sp. NPDC002795 TaxID=3364665 RepID=UPI00368E782B